MAGESAPEWQSFGLIGLFPGHLGSFSPKEEPMQNGPSGRTRLTPGMAKGLRLLLRFRVPESEVDAIFHRIIDSLAVRSPRSSQELVALITQAANEICPRLPRSPRQ